MSHKTPTTLKRNFTTLIWSPIAVHLRMFVRNFPNIDFFLKLLPLKDDELVMSEM